ncbi:hypothetical protein TELCIR_16753, partial [Teladorsagia circumcincta]
QQVSMLSYGARYTTPIWTAAATLGSSGAHFTYYHKQAENLAFGVEFESNSNVGEAVGTFAYVAELPDEGVTMRASIDTNWSVGGVFEKRLSQQLPFTLALSGIFNHAKFTSDVVNPPALLYMGVDKYQNEELIKIGFHDHKKVKRCVVAKRINEIVNRLNKTEKKEDIDYRQVLPSCPSEEREQRDIAERRQQRKLEQEKKARELKEAEEREALRRQRHYEDVDWDSPPQKEKDDGNLSDDF